MPENEHIKCAFYMLIRDILTTKKPIQEALDSDFPYKYLVFKQIFSYGIL